MLRQVKQSLVDGRSPRIAVDWDLWSAHFGVDSLSKLIHAAVVRPANLADCTVLPDLLHGQETGVWGDQAFCKATAASWMRSSALANLFMARRHLQQDEQSEGRHGGLLCRADVSAYRQGHCIQRSGRLLEFGQTR